MTKQYWGDAMTMNCVWLFQEKQKDYPESGCTCDLYDSDGDLLEGKTKEDEDACQCYVEYWETSRVFLTREEAKDYGKSRPYVWGEENEGWRIYGVPCDGMMAEILGKHNKEFKDKVEHITEEIK